jgi:hypothetical protein
LYRRIQVAQNLLVRDCFYGNSGHFFNRHKEQRGRSSDDSAHLTGESSFLNDADFAESQLDPYPIST